MTLPLFTPGCRHAWVADPWDLASQLCVYCGAPRPAALEDEPDVERRCSPAPLPETAPPTRRIDWRARHREIRRRT